jgi:nicotinamidase-related amidase
MKPEDEAGGMSQDALLVVIDMQEVFRAPESPWATRGFDELRDPIGRLREAFGDRIVYTRFLVPEHPVGSWVPYYATFSEVARPERRGWLELAEPYRAWAPATLDRETFGKWGRQLEAAAGPSRTIVLCGVATDCCVISTALPAADDGAFVRVVGDATRGVTAEAHDRALAILNGYSPQIQVTTVDRELERLSAVTP